MLKEFLSQFGEDSGDEALEGNPETEQKVEDLKDRLSGFSGLKEPGEYRIKTNSDVFVSWRGPEYLIECRLMEEVCMVQKRSKETGQIKRKAASDSPEEALRMAYSMMEESVMYSEGMVE
jgi:hypothetical protein